jgi:hypothetical protein
MLAGELDGSFQEAQDEGIILLLMADLINGEVYVRAEYNNSASEDGPPDVGIDHIR